MASRNPSSAAPARKPLADPAFRALFAQISDAGLVVDTKSLRILLANQQALELLGYEDSEIQQLTLTDMVDEENRRRMENFAHSSFAATGISRLTTPLLPSDGFRFPSEVRLQRVDSGGFSFGLLCFTDLSERIRTNEDITLRNIAIANVHSGVTIADARQPDLPLIYVNKGFQQMTGYTAKEAVGRSCRFLQGNDRAQPQLDELRDALREGRACVVRLRNYRKDGTLFYNELHISPVHNDAGELTHFVGIQIDVTERERARESLARSESRYRQLANTVDDLIIRRNSDDVIEFASSASNRMLGLSPEQLIGTNLKSLLHPEDRAALTAQVNRILHSEGPRTITFRMRMPNNVYRWFESRDRLVTDNESDEQAQPSIVSVIRDVTLRKRAEEETRKALEKEKEINEMKTAFISLVSHEFRTPMTGIQSSAALLRKYGDRLGEEKKARHLANIESALRRMNRLLDDVLFFSRAEADKLRVNCTRVDLAAYFNGLTESLWSIYPDHEVRIDLSAIPPGETFLLDEHLLNHILSNLIGNALKYSPLSEAVHVTVSCSETDLTIRIADKGIGIPEADQPKMFEAFHRASNVGTIQGTGIGLNIAQRAVELLRGRISFVSEQGKGSTFTVVLPRPPLDPQAS